MKTMRGDGSTTMSQAFRLIAGLGCLAVISACAASTPTAQPPTTSGPARPAPKLSPPQSCAASNDCTPETFADAMIGYAGVDGQANVENVYAVETWERAEGGNWNNSA